MATLYQIEREKFLRETASGISILSIPQRPQNECTVEPGVTMASGDAGIRLQASEPDLNSFLLRAGIREQGREIY